MERTRVMKEKNRTIKERMKSENINWNIKSDSNNL